MDTISNTEQFKEMIREEWTDPATVAAWQKWCPQFVIQSHEATDVIIQAAEVEPGMHVLDLASGTGEPAFALAKAVGADGHVTATDLSLGMITVAKENACQAALTNLTFQEADVHALPFPDKNFDRVTCRFGVMYFADLRQAFHQIFRVLKPGGRVALTAWSPLEQNPFLANALEPFLKRIEVPPPPMGAPHPFRFAQPGTLTAALEDAGFQQVQEEFRTIRWAWPGTPEQLWQYFRETAVPFHPIIESLPTDQREQAIREVITGFRKYYDGEHVNTPAVIVVASGVR